MEISKQVPSITVNIRVPAAIHERLESVLYQQQLQGMKVSKNSMYVEALTIYLDMMEEIGVDRSKTIQCEICGKKQVEEIEEVGVPLTAVNGDLMCSKCFLALISANTIEGSCEP